MSKSLLERFDEDYIRNVFKTSNTVDECCKKLQTITKYVGKYAKLLNCEEDYKRIKNNKADPIHNYPDAYEKTKGEKGNCVFRIIPEIWIKYVLENKIECYKAWKVLKILVQTGYKEYKCECCGISEWNDKPISLQLHHINGNHKDNSLENIQILCPNCHTQTDNYGSKNTVEKRKC